ncbi:MAG: hypothetical protein LWY06_02340 [Firmicutes bacterium]|nr:hypothetical protein [Bacillota bacterium]
MNKMMFPARTIDEELPWFKGEKAVLFPVESAFLQNRHKLEGFSRIYFGPEFCWRRLPSVNTVDEIAVFCRRNDFNFTFVTPFLPENGIAAVDKILEHFDRKKYYPEILVSDWGMLQYIPEKYGNRFPLVAGRLLAKQKTGPRIELIKEANPNAYISARKNHLDIPELLNFLKSAGVIRLELDLLLQGIDLQLSEDCSLPLSFYYPYAYVSTTRRCPIMEAIGCACEDSAFEMQSKDMPVKLFSKGNTVFLKHEKIGSDYIHPEFDRVVYEPDIP